MKNKLYRRNFDGELVLVEWNPSRRSWEYYIQGAPLLTSSSGNPAWWRAGNQGWQKVQCKRNAKLIGVNVEFK